MKSRTVVSRFAIGSSVYFGKDEWKVVKYHKDFGRFELMVRCEKTGEHRSFPLRQIEQFAGRSFGKKEVKSVKSQD